MTLTKAHIAQKVADDCGFMRGEACRSLGETSGYYEEKAHRRRRHSDFRFREMGRQIQTLPEG